MSRRRKILLWLGFSTLGFVLALSLAAFLVVRSGWFREKVRERIITEVERATGGRVEIGRFGFDWRTLRAEVVGFVIHGKEPAGETPLFQARSIAVGLKIISALRRDIDIALLAVDKPEVTVAVYPDGSTNLPQPSVSRRGDRNLVAPLLALAVQRFNLTAGFFHYASETVPIDVKGEDLRAVFTYSAALPSYSGNVSIRRLLVTSPKTLPLAFDTEVSLTVEKDRIKIPKARFALAQSNVAMSGAVENLRKPRAEFEVRSKLSLEDIRRPLRIPLVHRGSVEITGKATLGGSSPYSLDGRLVARGLAVERGTVRLRDIRVESGLLVSPDIIRLREMRVAALDGVFLGQAVVEHFRDFIAEGQVRGFSIQKLVPSLTPRTVAWNGIVSGPVRVEGILRGESAPGVKASGQFDIAPASGGLALQGAVDVAFDQRKRTIQFNSSHLATGSSRVDFSGTLDENMQVGLFSHNLSDLLPAVALFSEKPPDKLPLELQRGVASFDGTVAGSLRDPHVQGHVSLEAFVLQGHPFDRLSAMLDLTGSSLSLRKLALQQGPLALQGNVEVGLANWKIVDASALAGGFTVRDVSIERLLAAGGYDLPSDGTAAGSVQLQGTVGSPNAFARLTVEKLSAYNEAFDLVKADVRYTEASLEVVSARLEAQSGVLQFQGTYEHPKESWKNGRVRFDMVGKGFRLAQWNFMKQAKTGLDAGLDWRARGAGQIRNSRPQLTALHGDVSLHMLALNGNTLGSVQVSAMTRGNVLISQAEATLKGSDIHGKAEWSLEGESFGLGQVQFENLTLTALHDVGLFGGPGTTLPLEGEVDGEIGFSGPVLEPSTWRGMAKVTKLVLQPTEGKILKDTEDLTLRNAAPLLFAIDPNGISVQTAHIVSKDTDLEVSGTLSFHARNPWNLSLKGSINLVALRAFRTDLLTSGKSTVDTVIRGSFSQPQVTGRMELADASFYLRDLPNGLDKVNGVILFDRSRATIEKFTSQTGGGTLTLGGFVGFGGEESVYRLQATADRVRVRYPEGVSTLFNANLSLTGTSTRSLLSGGVSVLRADFTPSTDVASLLTQANKPPGTTVSSNAFLRGMQFDIVIDTAANAEFRTALTSDIQLEADLTLRGGPDNPVLLGRVSVNEGEIQFFGNKYDIVQGEISFFNPVKIEPVLAMDLETKVRGVTVTINFSGPINKLNVSYRSDPPLQSQEIVALLTVGRAPGSAATLASNPGAQGQGFLQAGGNSLLGQALSAPVSSRLQKFFGVSRLKIDPQLTGVENTPQALLTIEQQISRDITLTYTTNLARTQQQLVRIEWDLSRTWSLLAIRDSNGIFGIDFVYRRRFK